MKVRAAILTVVTETEGVKVYRILPYQSSASTDVQDLYAAIAEADFNIEREGRK